MDMETRCKNTRSNDGTEIYYETYAAPGSQTHLLFVHGLGGDLDAWQFVREHLSESGYSAVALDLRGHGYSGHPTSAQSYTLEKLHEDILCVLDAEGLQQVVLVGHSGGAIGALSFALRHPERLRALVLIAGSSAPPHYMRNALVRTLLNTALSVGAVVRFRKAGKWHSPYPQGKFHKEVEWYGLMRTMYHNSMRSYLLLLKTFLKADLREGLASVHTPTLLIIAGEKDGIYPLSVSKTIQEELPGARLAVIPNANHVTILNNPAEVAAAIKEFLPSI